MKPHSLILFLCNVLLLISCKTDKDSSINQKTYKDESSKSLEKKSYYQNGKLRTIEVFNKKSQLIETKLYDSINGNLLTVLTPNPKKTKLNDWYKQYFNQNDILQIEYGDLSNNGVAEDAIILVNEDESTNIGCFVFIKNANGGFIKEGQNFDITIDRDSIAITFFEQGFKVNTKHSFELEWKRSLSFKREGQKWYLDKDVFTDTKDKDYVFIPKEKIEFADFNPKKNLPKEIGINLEDESKERNVVVASSVQELLDGIDDYTTVYLRPGEYNLSSIKTYKRSTMDEGLVDNHNDRIDEEDDQGSESSSQLLIRGVHDFSMIGLGRVELITNVPQSSVVEFENCSNIIISNVSVYHKVNEFICTAPVISFSESEDSKVIDCVLDGSGETGISLYSSRL